MHSKLSVMWQIARSTNIFNNGVYFGGFWKQFPRDVEFYWEKLKIPTQIFMRLWGYLENTDMENADMDNADMENADMGNLALITWKLATVERHKRIPFQSRCGGLIPYLKCDNFFRYRVLSSMYVRIYVL